MDVADMNVSAGNSLRVSVANDFQTKRGLGGNGTKGGVRPFLDAAIRCNDLIYLAITPNELSLYRFTESGDQVLTGFGKEFEYLKSKDYAYEPTTGLIKRKYSD